jgi:2-amino-4-hydroxy-6-hydroxymethyldihydropteridine diphosphokinase
VIDAFIGLGSNLGDRLDNLATAVAMISREPGFTLRNVSLAYESEPIGPPQPRYLNAVVHVGTLVSPRTTLQRLQAIEEQMGRIRRERWGSREIDLDLLLYGDRLVTETGLQVPHPLLEGRAFVLVPLAEIAPEVVHRVSGLTARQLRDRLSPQQLATVVAYRPIRTPLPEPSTDEKSVVDPRQ